MLNGEIIAFALYFFAMIGVGIFFFLKDTKRSAVSVPA